MQSAYTNHLIHEKSPYLLSHAHNPVNWYPWGPEAFGKARAENKPVFLSIGYSTCHWCHVMERESFENSDVANLLNQYFISIKVDREERPDIDSVYMAVCQAVNQSGGWPLTILMTPDQKPFFAATYLPRTSRGQTPGLIQILTHFAARWKNEEDKLRQAGASVCDYLEQAASVPADSDTSWPDKELFHQAASLFLQTFDDACGGFGQAPKFPTPHHLLFLLHYGRLEHNKTAEYAAARTLFAMMRGGIFDHIGGGFSRYSTDRKWLVPHFEKMLYDNALLALAYLECWEQTGAAWCLWTARRTFLYVFRELTGEKGGFFCGQDADSEGVEGKYYLLSPDEVCQVLGTRQGEALCLKYDITETGNFEQKSIPNLIQEETPWIPDDETAKNLELLYQWRLDRYPLHKDDKVLTSWSALMAMACAKGARAAFRLQQQATAASQKAPSDDILDQCLATAQNSLAFIRRHLTRADGRLLVRFRDGEAAHSGHLDDYAFYALARLSLYRTTFDAADLEEAVRTARLMTDFFFDTGRGGFYLYASDSETLISRPTDTWDGAMPSGNSAAAHVLCQLAGLTALPEWMELRDKQISFLTREAGHYPAGYSFALLAMMEVVYPAKELICVLPGACTDPLRQTLAVLPDKGIHILVKTPENAALLARLAPFTADYPIRDTAQYYLCENGSCRQPVEDPDAVVRQIMEG